jgi:hypothetical protein
MSKIIGLLFILIFVLGGCYNPTSPEKTTIILSIFWPYYSSLEYSVNDGVWTPHPNTRTKDFWLSLQDFNKDHYPPDSPEWWAFYKESE